MLLPELMLILICMYRLVILFIMPTLCDVQIRSSPSSMTIPIHYGAFFIIQHISLHHSWFLDFGLYSRVTKAAVSLLVKFMSLVATNLDLYFWNVKWRTNSWLKLSGTESLQDPSTMYYRECIKTSHPSKWLILIYMRLCVYVTLYL